MSLAQMFTRVFGAVYVLVGILGFVGFVGGTASQSEGTLLLGIFGVNLVHNIAHLGVGIAFLAASATDKSARIGSMAIGATYVLLGILGVLNIGFFESLINDNGADNGLHFATGILALVIAFVGKGATGPRTTGGSGSGFLSGDQMAKY